MKELNGGTVRSGNKDVGIPRAVGDRGLLILALGQTGKVGMVEGPPQDQSTGGWAGLPIWPMPPIIMELLISVTCSPLTVMVPPVKVAVPSKSKAN